MSFFLDNKKNGRETQRKWWIKYSTSSVLYKVYKYMLCERKKSMLGFILDQIGFR